MANWTQRDGAPKPATDAEASTTARISDGNVPGGPGGGPAAVPCLIPSFADAVKLLDSRYSCLALDTHRRHVALPPANLKKKRSGIQQELDTELLKYSSSLDGVPLAYDNIKVIGQCGDIYDDLGYIHINIEASFVVFKPQKGSRLVGVINKIGVSHVGCLVHGCFNASVVKPAPLTPEQWRDSGLCVGDSLEFEVFQLDADTAGVLLIRGRLPKSRVQELIAQTQHTEETADPATEPEPEPEPEPTEASETIDSPKAKKKKKKDKREKEAVEDSLNETEEVSVNNIEVDSNSNGHHTEKKKKKKDKRKELHESLQADPPSSDSSGYTSGKTSRKRPAESEDVHLDDSETPAAKKKKKSK